MRKRLLAILLATILVFMSIGVTAAEDGTVLTQETFKSHSLALSDCIGVIFYMDLSPLTEQERETSYMSFDISGAGTVEERAEYDPTFRNGTGEYYGFTCEVNAIQMADILTATYHYGNGQVISETYSIRQYIQTFEAYQAYQDETTVALVHALADYGHHSQLFLSEVNNLPVGNDSDQYAPMDQYYTESYDFDFIRSEVEPFAISREKDDTALKSIPYTLILDSRMELRVYFQPTPEFDGTPFFKLNGESVTAEEENGRYTVSIPGILPHKIGDTYLITAEADGANIAAVSISPLSYVYAMLSSSAYANNLQALNAAASIYMYYKAAKAYSAIRNWNLPTYEWAEDNSTVTATRVSMIDASVTETETVNTTSEITKPAACEEPGEITYTASFENTAFEAQIKTVEIPALGHAWGEWTVTTPATCTEAGVETRTCANDASHTETRAIEALGHAWGEPTYEWAADNSTVTATRVCANDANHVETETVSTTAVINAATCEAAGSTTYTATFENAAFETQTKAVEIPATGHTWGEWTVTTPATCTEAGVETRTCANDASHTETRAIEALGHAWGEVTYEWTADNSTVTATRVCANDANHIETETVNTTAVTTDATCEAAGSTTYTATFENEAFEAQTKAVEIPATGHAWGEWTVTTPATCTEAGVETRICANDASHTETRAIEALGHAWGEVTYEWAEDNSTVTATRICANNASHIETETVNTTAVTNAATCEAAGSTIYTATFENVAFETQTRTVEIPALGHAWGEWTVTTPATCTEAGVETRTCANDASHTETRPIEALGHAWGEPTWSWTDGYTAASATFTCSHDGSHTHTVDATVAQNDCLGYTDYTATASFSGQSYSDTKHVSFAAFYLIGPDWTVADINAANKFEVNPSNAAEYMLTVDLTAGDQIKVVKVEDGAITAWYPDGLNNEYTVDAAHAGDEKTIYFSETYRNDWSAFGGYIWIDASAQVQLNTFTHSDNLVNVDTYLYRVGNGNTVKLGSLFKVETEGDSAVVSDDVSVTIEKVETNSTVALGSYAKNSSDWTQSTLKFTGEGPVRVTVREGSGTPYTLNLEIVTANNATTATSATSANIVLLNNVSGGLSVSNGRTLYGNGFSVTDTRSNPSGTAGYVNVTNGTVDNVKFIGYEPTTAVASGTSNAGYAPSVRAANGANLYNVYISGGRYALLIDGGTVSLKNTMLDGGAVGNMKLEGGTLVLEDCVTATSTRGGLKGLGIHLTSTNAKIVIKGTFEQHNWLTFNDMPSAYQSMLSGMFNNSTYAYTSGSNKYVNMGILGLIDGQNFYASSMQSQITDDTNNDYGYVEKSAAGSITGTLYTAKASMGSAEMLADPVDERMQHATLPSFTFDYTNKNYIPNTGDDTFCYYDTTTQKVAISLKQSSTEDVFDWDPMILESKKYGQTLGYTVTMNGADYTDQIISFSENGDYTVTYTVTDPYNFDKDVNKSSVVYQKEVKISVTIIEPDAVVYHPEFSYAGDWSSYQATSVSAGGSTYIMPNVTGTSDTIASTTVSGTTVYMPIITVAGKNSSGGNYSSGRIYCFAPAFSAINITDKDVNTGGVLYTYNSSTQKWPHNQSATTGPNRDYYGPNSVRDPYGAGTGATYEKYAYNANNGGLCYTSNEIERDVNANTKTVKFFYVGNDGITYYYYIQYKYQAVTYKSCVAEGTQILMADGSQKAVEDVQMGDMVMTWSFENGCYEAAPVAIKWYHGTDDFRVLNLEFSDGTVVRVINTHGFFDRDLNTYAYIREGNADDYLGHTFVKRTPDGDNTEVVLVNSYITEERVGNYSLQTAYNDNFIAENLLTITAEDHVGRFEYFPIGDNMMYDAEAKARDIETYGLYTYEEFADWLTEEQFIMFNGPYFKVLVGRGVLTYEDILEIIRVNLYANETAQ